MAYELKDAKGKVVMKDGKKVFGSDLSGVIKAVDLDKRTLVMIGTDETRDRDGEIVKTDGWDLKNFLTNPVFLWAHNYASVPLAAATKVVRKRSPWRLEFYEKFPTIGLNPFADMILELYNERVINASSVGFIPKKWNNIEEKVEGQEEPLYTRVFTEQELLELSGCPVGCNPAALQSAVSGKSFGDASVEELVHHLDGNGLWKLGKAKKIELLEELVEVGKGIVFEEETAKVHQVPDDLTGTDEEEEGGMTKVAAFKYCVCSECGYHEDKDAGKPCQDIKCPECGHDLKGSDEIPKKEVDEEISLEDKFGNLTYAYEGLVADKDALDIEMAALTENMKVLAEQNKTLEIWLVAWNDELLKLEKDSVTGFARNQLDLLEAVGNLIAKIIEGAELQSNDNGDAGQPKTVYSSVLSHDLLDDKDGQEQASEEVLGEVAAEKMNTILLDAVKQIQALTKK